MTNSEVTGGNHMTLTEYQDAATATVQYPEWGKVLYPLLGLIGEAGELVAKFHCAVWPYGHPIPEGEEPYQQVLLAAISIGQRCETLKKQIRGGTDGLTDQQRREVAAVVKGMTPETTSGLEAELMDVLWYISAMMTDMGCDLEDGVRRNLDKLAKRKRAGTIHNHKPDSREDILVDGQ